MSDTSKTPQGTKAGPDGSGNILLGRITGAHGIKGELLVHSFAAVREDIAAYGSLSDKEGTRQFRLRVLGVTPKGALIVRIAGIADRNGAENLKGVELYVARDKLPETEEGEFYYADLIGIAAVSPDGSPIGEIVAVQNYGAGDLLEIRLPSRRETELVPFSDAFVPQVDIPGNKVVVVMPVSSTDDDAEDSPS